MLAVFSQIKDYFHRNCFLKYFNTQKNNAKCPRERERERVKETDRQRQTDKHRQKDIYLRDLIGLY